MQVYFQCSRTSESTAQHVSTNDGWGKISLFTPDCTGVNETGVAYIELLGDGPYSLSVDID